MLQFRANVRSEEIILPIGIYLKKFDQRFDTCVVKAMDGNDEEITTEKKLRNNGAKIVTKLLGKKIIKVGDHDFPDGVGESVAREMFSEDRDTCLVAIRGLMKDEMEVTATCSRCGEKYEGIIYMKQLLDGIRQWKDREDYDDGLEIGVVEFELPDGLLVKSDDTDGKEVLCKKGRLKMPNGVAEENIAGSRVTSVGKANSLLLSACIMEIENIRKVDQYVVQAMSRVDREYLSDVISNAKCGPDLRVKLTCDMCDNEFEFMLQLPYFFTTGQSRR